MKNVVRIAAALALLASVLFIAIPALANTTVTGEVGMGYNIISEDGTVYVIAETEKGEELAAMVGEIVKVTGTVQESEGEKVITVESFTLVDN